MSIYWKQSLWVGGVYWVLSQFFSVIGTFESYSLDALLSVVMLVFLLPMNKFCPIKSVNKAMYKMPVLSTFLVSVGWVPYFVGLLFVVSTVAAFVIAYMGEMIEYRLFSMLNMIAFADTVRRIIFIVILLWALIYVLIMHKSVVGCLDKKYRLIKDASCDVNNIGEAAKMSAKNMYECKNEKDNDEEKKQSEKSVAKKSTSKTIKKAVKIKESKEKILTEKKVEKKPTKKSSLVKKKIVKKKAEE